METITIKRERKKSRKKSFLTSLAPDDDKHKKPRSLSGRRMTHEDGRQSKSKSIFGTLTGAFTGRSRTSTMVSIDETLQEETKESGGLRAQYSLQSSNLQALVGLFFDKKLSSIEKELVDKIKKKTKRFRNPYPFWLGFRMERKISRLYRDRKTNKMVGKGTKGFKRRATI